MTATATYHDIEPYAVERNGMASARCLTHLTATAEQWPTMSQAARGFCCDEGRNLRFITEFSGEDLDLIPVMRDLPGLARTIRSDAQRWRRWPRCWEALRIPRATRCGRTQ